MRRIACVLMLVGLAAGEEWAETLPVFTLDTGACSVSGNFTDAREPGLWYRLGYRGPGEYLLCVGHVDDGTPLLVVSDRGTFYYDPLARTLFELERTGIAFHLGVEAGRFVCQFTLGPTEDAGGLDFRIDLRSIARGLVRSVRVEDGRRTGLTPKGTYLSFWTAPSGVLTRVALDSSSDYRCEARIGGKCATSLGAESLAALRSMAKRATPAEEERIRTDVHRVFQLLPLFGDEAARARLGKAEAADFDWPALIESHVRMRALLDRAVGAGPAFGGYEDGLGLAAKGDNAEAFASWLEAAHAGDARSMFRVGWAVVADHDFGKPAEGFEWLRRSAEAGYGPAFTILGGTYLRGVGCEPDLAKARRWLEAAVERDDSRARYELGWMCMRGQGVEPEVDRALALWKAAAARGHAPSMNTLGIVFEHGRGVEADAAEAASWYQRAADLGYAEAMVRLGHLYESGRGVPQDKARAFELCKRAVETGSARAKYELAICYDRGTGVDRNPARTRELMLASARGGYGFAQLTVANAYLEGKWGFSKSLPRGAAWLRIAADGGNEKAQKKLEQIEPTMSEAERVIWYATLAELQQEMRKDGQGSGSTR